MITANQYDSVEDIATTNETSIDVNCKYVNYIINDSLEDDLYVSFENSIDEDDNYITIKPYEEFGGFKVVSKKIYLKASANTVTFRLLCSDEVPSKVRC